MTGTEWSIPLMVRESLDQDSYHGFVKVHGHCYRMRVCGGGPQGKLALEMQPELYHLLAADEPVLRQRLVQSEDVASFLWELKEILDRVSSDGALLEAPGAAAMEGIVREIEEVGWDCVVDLDEGFKNIDLSIPDAAGREHVLSVHVPGSYPAHAPVCRALLPIPFAPTWRHGCCLGDLVSQFRTTLGQYQDLWDILDDLDKYTHVLEPERPTRDILMRRIAIGRHSSIQLQIDPHHPRSVPEVRFLGADSVVLPLRDNLNSKLSRWDRSQTVRCNLESILDLSFPQRKDKEVDEMGDECAICYCYRLEGVAPEIVCENPKCTRIFHPSCLYSWLRALPTARLSFNTLFGTCMYCSHPIVVKNASNFQGL